MDHCLIAERTGRAFVVLSNRPPEGEPFITSEPSQTALRLSGFARNPAGRYTAEVFGAIPFEDKVIEIAFHTATRHAEIRRVL